MSFMDGPGVPPKPEWRKLYEAAVLELDRTKMLELIERTRAAISARAHELSGEGPECEEQQAMRKALMTLHRLQNIAENKRAG